VKQLFYLDWVEFRKAGVLSTSVPRTAASIANRVRTLIKMESDARRIAKVKM
jgi:hypothetical protein